MRNEEPPTPLWHSTSWYYKASSPTPASIARATSHQAGGSPRQATLVQVPCRFSHCRHSTGGGAGGLTATLVVARPRRRRLHAVARRLTPHPRRKQALGRQICELRERGTPQAQATRNQSLHGCCHDAHTRRRDRGVGAAAAGLRDSGRCVGVGAPADRRAARRASRRIPVATFAALTTGGGRGSSRRRWQRRWLCGRP
eukprot:352243-Chlamydomonas_euryale.AAC.1